MASTPSSPINPSHRRRSLRLSSIEAATDASHSQSTNSGTNMTSFSRRSSRTSQTSFQQDSPTTQRPMSRSSRQSSFHHRRKSSSRLSISSNLSISQSEAGRGNLADELGDALEDEYEIQTGGFLDGSREAYHSKSPFLQQSPHEQNDVHGIVLLNEIQPDQLANHTLQPIPLTNETTSKAEKRKSRHQKTESKYDGSDYGPESDQDEDGLPPMLAKRMRDIETLTRMSINTEDTLSEGGGVVKRTLNALKDLGPQANIENNLSRIITAYTSMATHRIHKTRDLFSQAHSLLYGNVLELPEDTIDLLLSEIESLAASTPFLQKQDPLLSLQILASQTLDLAQTLRTLTDVLQESRISANTASRKLKSVRDMVDELRMEEDLTEESMLLIQAGDWDRRCRERQAAAICQEVVEGFGSKWSLEVEERAWTRKRDVTVS